MTNLDKYEDIDTDFRALPAGTELLDGQYRIESYLSSGGFGITYLATDSLGRRVVIKECFPEALCRRTDKTVRTKTSRSINEFNALVEMFVREARSLAKLNHPNIVGVHQIFRANDTAYMVLDFVNGRDAMQLLECGSAPLEPARVVSLARDLLSAISAVHNADMLHRDISPDNILIDENGAPCLIDFGAARQEATKKSRAISALMVVKDGYSPQEFYISGGQQGPASDLYSLGATLFHLITGEAPPNSQTRLAALAARKPDPYQPLAPRNLGYGPNFLRAIDLSMNVFPKDRPQSADQWAEIISGQVTHDPRDDRHVRKVVSNLVSEVAMSLAAEAEEKARQVEEEPQPEELSAVPTPEEDRWWPLTEEPEEPEPETVAIDNLGDYEAEALTLPSAELETAASSDEIEPDQDAAAQIATNEVLEGMPVADDTPDRNDFPPDASCDGEAATNSGTTKEGSVDFIAAIREQAESASAGLPPTDEDLKHSRLEEDAHARSRRKRRRMSALVIIAALTIAFQDAMAGHHLGTALANFGVFLDAVTLSEARL